jgi:hypothetical protein
MSVKDRDGFTDPSCECGKLMEQAYDTSKGGWFFKYKPGQLTGMHDYDYGKKSTWDLTPDGKMDTLKRLGKITDPFDYGPPPVTNDHLVGDL